MNNPRQGWYEIDLYTGETIRFENNTNGQTDIPTIGQVLKLGRALTSLEASRTFIEHLESLSQQAPLAPQLGRCLTDSQETLSAK